jgi:CDGSH-type Zn-finger protein
MTRIVPYRNGPYVIRGDFELLDQDGRPIATHRGTIALCRCGRSRMRPFCDGTHSAIKFEAPSEAEVAPYREPGRPPRAVAQRSDA